MQATSHNFKANARRALDDAVLQRALGNVKTGFQEKRRQVIEELPEFEAPVSYTHLTLPTIYSV